MRKLQSRLLLVLIFVITGIDTIEGREQLPVRMRLEPLSVRGRSGGPVPLRIKLEYNLPQLREGNLLLQIYNSFQTSSELMATIRYEGIVLQGQDYIFSTILPPIEHSANKQYLITGWFETETERIPLTADPDLIDPPEPHELLSIGLEERATLVCSCSGRLDFMHPSNNLKFLNNVLSLDNYNPIRSSADGSRAPYPSERVQHFAAAWNALDLPEDPLHLCCFDVVVLADSALSRLDDSQLRALTTWLEAGGSLCVQPDGNRLKASHLQFLQATFESPDFPGFGLSLTDQNSLLVISNSPQPVVCRHVGLGRAVLLPVVDSLEDELTPEQLHQAVAHLWKVRTDSAISAGKTWGVPNIDNLLNQNGFRLVNRNGKLIVMPNESESGVGMGMYGRIPPAEFTSIEEVADVYQLNLDLRPNNGYVISACKRALLPTGVESVPAHVVGLLLAGYILVIGPIDYFVLGWLRARKYTWILFPLVTAVFTVVMVGTAHHYMQASDTGGRLTMTDIVGNGRAVRETEVRMHFYGAQTTATDKFTSSLTVPAQASAISTMGFGAGPQNINQHMYYSGRFPQKYSASSHVPQWTPQLTRSTTFNPSQDHVPEIDWNDDQLVRTPDGVKRLTALLTSWNRPEEQWDGVILHGERMIPLVKNGFLFQRHFREDEHSLELVKNFQPRYDLEQIPSGTLLCGAVIASARWNGERDFSQIVSQVSPHGAASMEDLPLLDVSAPNQRILILTVQRGSDTHVFRKLYRPNDGHIISSAPAERTDAEDSSSATQDMLTP